MKRRGLTPEAVRAILGDGSMTEEERLHAFVMAFIADSSRPTKVEVARGEEE